MFLVFKVHPHDILFLSSEMKVSSGGSSSLCIGMSLKSCLESMQAIIYNHLLCLFPLGDDEDDHDSGCGCGGIVFTGHVL